MMQEIVTLLTEKLIEVLVSIKLRNKHSGTCFSQNK